jgi:KaiC/GvpD/RAD55 family RecA-like ATPase
MQTEIKYPTLSADHFELKPAYQWIRDAKRKEMPEKLLNDLWSEGEMVAMIGDTGSAKSVFAVQIAETLAGGGSFSASRSRRGPRKVLYVDTDANEKQFESRYAADHAGGRARFLHRHYKFAPGLTRAEYDAGMLMPKKGESIADLFIADLRTMAAAAGADTIIIDSLTSLVSSHYGNRQLTELLVGLRRLRKEMGLSILVVLQTVTPNRTSGLRMGTALFRAVASRTDGIFGLAGARTGENRVYLKQISSRNAPILYDSAHVPVFEVRKLDDNYLSFELAEYAPEAELLDDIRNEQEWEICSRCGESPLRRRLSQRPGRSRRPKMKRRPWTTAPSRNPSSAAIFRAVRSFTRPKRTRGSETFTRSRSPVIRRLGASFICLLLGTPRRLPSMTRPASLRRWPRCGSDTAERTPNATTGTSKMPPPKLMMCRPSAKR